MELKITLLYLFLFVFGISIGSFLNVLIYRLPRSIPLTGRSFCPKCKAKIKWYDNIPLLTFLFLGGRCRACHSPIGFQYPLVEAATGIIFVLTFYLSPLQNLPDLLTLIYYLFLLSALIVIFAIDLKHQIIPDQIIYPAVLITFAFHIVSYKLEIIDPINLFASSLGAGLLFFLLVFLTRGRGMGMGDVKLAFLMGLVLGFPKIAVAFYLAFLTGAILGVILILVGKKRFGQHIPFGPFLAFSTFISLFWGEEIWQVLTKILGLT